ncbi:MAG: hypothetical protein HFJ25_04275 [Clostridia bacterium]|nr:hypothetical protein [Clostridia bacterium]
MTLETYGFKRIADKYEKMFQENPCKLIKEKQFHIEQLEMSIDAADEILGALEGEMEDWSSAMTEVCMVDDADTPWKKFQMLVMKKYVDYRYMKVYNEAINIGKQKDRLIQFMKSLFPTYDRE